MPADPAADRADLQALRSGDATVFERIVARWEQPLCAYAWRYLRNGEDAREVALETFVRLHEHRARLRADTNLSAWLYTTLTNLCHNRHRWWRRHPSVSLDALPAEGDGAALGDGAPPPDAASEQREALAALDAAIAALPHELRATLLLHHFEQLSYREIAGIVGCSERGVETRLYRARQALRSALSAVGPFAAAR
ncbi:RNA polymerase sigma factor [Oleiharenicola sp. Vm1]|uniref:RNA polymerase sigma factor n=1 Tax=Oleiharenicola sp. Vm1 TaxID=3398393 RepID=UPI0039F6268F